MNKRKPSEAIAKYTKIRECEYLLKYVDNTTHSMLNQDVQFMVFSKPDSSQSNYIFFMQIVQRTAKKCLFVLNLCCKSESEALAEKINTAS